MRAVYGLAFALACVVLCVAGAADDEVAPVSVQKIYVEKKTKNDLESQATGYIFRSDGDSPPILIKLGNGNIHQYDDVLKRAGEWSRVAPPPRPARGFCKHESSRRVKIQFAVFSSRVVTISSTRYAAPP